eukprot:TRINITY_DN2910_c0_g1_i1.p1 TRINITY_DN2910_c0_g1~~TRINITY_DN2910_c0_g1_i1.p1  ORF type:complete len:380 (+),score=125.91 TRINITY_DN2910_c0_g1_i1:63-1202(+)
MTDDGSLQRSGEFRFSHERLESEVVLAQGSIGRVHEVIWQCAVLQSRWLCANKELVQGRCVLELGAGIGLVGIVAAACGARRVVLTDVDEGLPILRSNVDANGAAVEAAGAEVVVDRLFWGDAGDIRSVRERFGEFDLILGADVVYNQSEGELVTLARTVDALRSKGSKCCIAYGHRGDWLSNVAFFEEMQRLGFEAEQSDLEQHADCPTEDFLLYTFAHATDLPPKRRVAIRDVDGDEWELVDAGAEPPALSLSVNGASRPRCMRLRRYGPTVMCMLPAVVGALRVCVASEPDCARVCELAAAAGVPVDDAPPVSALGGVRFRVSVECHGDDGEVKALEGSEWVAEAEAAAPDPSEILASAAGTVCALPLDAVELTER